MNKHKFYGIWHKISGLSLWLLLGIFLVAATVSFFALRQNNLKMIELRAAVQQADEQGGDVETALKQLREHVYSHMNTNLRAGSNSSEPPIQLTNRFNRIVAAEQARIAAQGGTNKIYQDAQAECEDPNVLLTVRAQCVQRYITNNGGGAKYELQIPPKEFYTFDFVSPTWSPDIAGWALVVTTLSGLLLIARLASGFFIKKYLAE